MIRASLTPKQLLDVLSLDSVVWADPTTAVGNDMDNARIQGGANAIEAAGNYLGQGVRAEVTEFFQETHPDFAGRFLVRGIGVDSHGHCTAGIVAGAGANNFAARGMMPQCTIIEGGYTSAANHYTQIQGSVNPALSWKTMVATASWGSAQTPSYTSISSAMDDALFDSDLTRCQSQSNLGTTSSRPEAWAKNIISGGGLSHGNNANPLDDVWTSASTGPASDGRLKPDACAYYDNVLTSDRTGTSGYSTGDYYSAFSGTSSATPIIAGHVGLIQQMFTDGLFGNPLPQPATAANRFANKPHMTTSKALLCNTAAQYAFSGATHNLTRTHQGWGFPSLSRLYDNRKKILVVDEYDTLQLGQSRTYLVWVAPGTPEFRATMVYADPAAVALASIQLINNANLKVTRLSDGTFWWGQQRPCSRQFLDARRRAERPRQHRVCLPRQPAARHLPRDRRSDLDRAGRQGRDAAARPRLLAGRAPARRWLPGRHGHDARSELDRPRQPHDRCRERAGHRLDRGLHGAFVLDGRWARLRPVLRHRGRLPHGHAVGHAAGAGQRVPLRQHQSRSLPVRELRVPRSGHHQLPGGHPDRRGHDAVRREWQHRRAVERRPLDAAVVPSPLAERAADPLEPFATLSPGSFAAPQ
jgi:hypothetical protein